jgi:hypothetical protein
MSETPRLAGLDRGIHLEDSSRAKAVKLAKKEFSTKFTENYD